MQNLGISIKIGSALESKGFNAAQKELSKIQSLNQSVLKSTLTPKVNLSPLNKLKSALNGIKAQVESLRNKDLELKVQGKIDSFKSSFVEKAAIGASIAMPIKAAIDFESSMADVKKVVDFDSNEELNAFGAEIRKLSQTIPLLPTELAKITASGGQLGIAKQDLMGFTTLVAKIGTAFDMSADQAGDTMAKIMNVYGLGLKEMEGLGDTINYISDNSAAKASEITEVLNRIGGTAKVMGLSAENAAALGSAFIAMGKAPEVAGTAINSFFTKLLAPEKQSASFRKALEEIGLSAEELKDSIQNNPQKGIEEFLETLAGIEKSEQMGILSDLFGAEFGDDMALLVSGIDNYKKAVALANDKNKVGSLQREFETRAATTENALTLLKSSVLNLGITIGSILLPPLNAIIGIIKPIINGFATLCETFPRISGVVVGAVAAFGSFIVASAGLGFVLNLVHLNILKALPYFSLFKSAIIASVAWLRAKNLGLLLVKAQLGATMVATRLYGIATLGLGKALAFGGAALKVFGGILSFVGKSLLLNPIFLIGAILAGGAFLIYKYWNPIKEFFSALWDKIKVGASVAWEGLKNVFKYSPLGILITSFSKVFSYFGTFWNHAKGLFVNSWEFLKSIFKWTPLGLIIQGFSAVTEYFSSLFATWVGMFSEVINKIGSAISRGLGKALAFGGAALKVFGGILSFVGKSLLLNPIFLIGAILAGGAYLIYKYWTPIKELFSVLWDKIKVGASVAWEGLKNVFKYSPLGILITSFSKVFSCFGTFWNHTKGLFVNSWEFLKSIFQWSPLGLIVQGFSVVTEYFSSLFATWVGMFSEVINKIGSAISSIKGFFGFGEKESSIKMQDSLALQPAQITPIEIKPIPQNPKVQAQNINVAFTGGIQVQTTDGKIPENSQLQRDIQREVEAALKKSKESERNRTLSDIDF